jgi:hypothetical protein
MPPCLLNIAVFIDKPAQRYVMNFSYMIPHDGRLWRLESGCQSPWMPATSSVAHQGVDPGGVSIAVWRQGGTGASKIACWTILASETGQSSRGCGAT